MIHATGLGIRSYNFTLEGLEELRRSIIDLKQQQRALVQEMSDTQSQSTALHTLEDSLYTIDQGQVIDIERQITTLERLVAMAHIITKPLSRSAVELGSVVTVCINGQEHTYTIVGPLEADPLRGSLSEESPLGKQLLGKQVREMVAIPCPADKKRIAQIIAIH